MAIPLDITIVYTIISIILFLLIGFLLFLEEPTILKTSFAMILCFINGVFSYLTAYTYFVVDLYGFDSSGVVVSNPMVELAPFGLLFVAFAFFSIIFSLYCIYLFYLTPWKKAMESYNIRSNPWYEQPDT